MKLRHVVLFLLASCSPVVADENKETFHKEGWRFTIIHDPLGGGVLDVHNGMGYMPVFELDTYSTDIQVEVGGIAVDLQLTTWRNNLPNTDDMLEVLDIEDGWMAWPAQLTLPEEDEGSIKIILNAMS
jgi:hypothetical protein